MKLMVETKYSTIFNIEEMYNEYLEYKYYSEKVGQTITLSEYLDCLETEYEEYEDWKQLIAFRENREKIYDLLTEERRMREGPQNLEV